MNIEIEENKSKLNEEGLKEKFGAEWWSKIRPFYLRGGFDSIFDFLKERSKLGHKILPNSEDLFTAFKKCPYSKLRVIAISMEPYASVTKEGIVVADGIALSCSKTKFMQPSLEKFIEGVELDTGRKFSDYWKNNICSLEYLAEQGVLLGNISLTVEKGKIGSHMDKGIWLPFWEFLITEVFNVYNPGLVYLLIGKDSHKVKPWIIPFNSYILEETHPSFAARNSVDWQTNIFTKTNTILESNNGFLETIMWNYDLPF